METPKAMRLHIGIFGDTNSGKSTLFNSILGQDMAIVSENEGTTTDPVQKAMEFIGFGPVVLVDTGGFADDSGLGAKRMQKTLDILKKMDYAIYTADVRRCDEKNMLETIALFNEYQVPYTVVFTKSDIRMADIHMMNLFPGARHVSVYDGHSVDELKNHLVKQLNKLRTSNDNAMKSLIKEGDSVILVTPIDSEAPKGRLILPQIQVLRECLDMGALCHICRDTELSAMLQGIKDISLVITDSQAFKMVAELVPENVRLTSFSMLMARQKGDLPLFFDAVDIIDSLEDKDVILMAETCTHTTSHEDIGRVKIPEMIKKRTGKDIQFEYALGIEYPSDLSKYSLIIHCGGCMITRKDMTERISRAKAKGVPITNYGVVLAYLTNTLKRQEFLRTDNG